MRPQNTVDFRILPLFASPEIGGIGGDDCTVRCDRITPSRPPSHPLTPPPPSSPHSLITPIAPSPPHPGPIQVPNNTLEWYSAVWDRFYPLIHKDSVDIRDANATFLANGYYWYALKKLTLKKTHVIFNQLQVHLVMILTLTS